MATTTRRQFTDAFKIEAVRLSRDSGRPVTQVVRAEQDELTRLRRENETLRKERDFLKRAAAFFARKSH